MPRFYINNFITINSEISLPGNVVQHLNVIRQKEGSYISIFNGNGNSYRAQILSLQRKSCLVLIKEQESMMEKPNVLLHLGLGVIANDKMDLAIRNATELGVKEITPIISNYSQKLVSDRLYNRMEHWQKVILSSTEQCGQNVIPKINHPMSLNDFVKLNASSKFILSLYKNQTFTSQELKKNLDTILLVGPEGGFTNAEIDLAIQNNYTAIKPWVNILRAETAVTAGLSLIINDMN